MCGILESYSSLFYTASQLTEQAIFYKIAAVQAPNF